ncbi:MAG: ABC transporter permease, partial [Flavobacterium sp.]|uniref:ABC transporter permease n=1 Tax=Flavobacterium sp. TaxID=239 RepID=UPI0040341F67
MRCRGPTCRAAGVRAGGLWCRCSGLQVSEQMDSLRVLYTDPVDYLVTPRVLASMVAGPILNVLCFCMGRSPSWVG